MKRLILILLSIFAVSFAASAQNTVKGTVLDNEGNPVIGAAVYVQDTNLGTVTDMDGKYTLSYSSVSASGTVIEVSCMGYKKQNVKVKGSRVLDFVLEEDSTMLDELVYVGYGSMRRSDLTGSLSSVKIDEDKADMSVSLDQLLQGSVSGVSIVNNSAAPGSGLSIRVRGVTSLNGSSEPLYVVDGIVMSDAISGSVSNDMAEETNGLLGLNPQDIASVEILKDASATAIYGADGANGVVLITTKQAGKDRTRVRFSVGVDYSTPYKYMDLLTFDQYVQLLETRSDTYAENSLSKLYTNDGTENVLKVTPVDWQKYSMRNVHNQRYYFSISGSPDKMNYSFSFGYKNQDGIVKSTGLEQYTSNFNIEKKFNNYFTFGAKMNLAYVTSESQQGAGLDAVQASSSMMTSILTYRPYTTTSLEEEFEDNDEEADAIYSGPDRWLKYARTTNTQIRVTPTLFATFNIIKGLSFTSKIGGDYRSAERTQWKGREVSRSTGAVAGVSEDIKYRWSWDNTANYSETFGSHYVNAMAGVSLGEDYSETHNVRATNVIKEDLQVENINSAYNATFSYSEVLNSRVSTFVRGVYSFADRYVLTATYRLDGSSKFLGENRFAGFPSAAASWYVSKEPWFLVPAISTLKLRFGWGRVGKSSVSAYQTMDVYTSNKYGNHFNESGYVSGIYLGNFSNKDLKWETTEQLNLGLDYAMFKGRLTLSADVYDKTTYDLLQSRKVPYLSGYATRWVNQGTINNRGVELSLEVVPLSTKNLEWILSGNFSINRNSITDLGFSMEEDSIYLEEGVESMRRYYLGNNVASSVYLRNPANIFMEGMPVGLFYGYKTDGLVQEGDTSAATLDGQPRLPGQVKYVDMNGNGIIDEDDRTIIGDNNPDFTYGFQTSFKLYGFNLSLNFDGVFGKDVLYANYAQITDPTYSYCTNVLKDAFYDAWTRKNPDAKFPAIRVFDETGVEQEAMRNAERAMVSDRMIHDASYLRLGSASLSYTLRMPKKSKVLRSLQIGVTGGNLIVFTQYPGWSPIVNSFGQSMTRIGVDVGSYPMARSYSLDVKFTF